MFVTDKDQLFEILYAYRLKNDPHTWIFCLEERTDLEGKRDTLSALIERLGAGKHTPRVVYELFADSYDAMQFFADIPAYSDRIHKKNKDMLKLRVLSSGQVK